MKQLILFFISSFYFSTIFAQNDSISVVSQIITNINNTLIKLDTCQYKTQMLFKEFSGDTFEVRNFNINYRINPENELYGYDWEIAEKLKSGYTLTLLVTQNDLFTIYDGKKVMSHQKLPDYIDLGSYTETMRNYFVLHEVFSPFTNIPISEITLIDSNNCFYLNRQMNSLATRQLILSKDTYLPVKYISKIKSNDFDLTQILEIDFYFDDRIRKLADTTFSPNHYLALGFTLKTIDTINTPDQEVTNSFSTESQKLLFNYPFLSEDGDTILLKTFKNNYIVLDFWYSSCLPCLKSMPILNEVADNYSISGLEVIGVNCFDKDNSTFLMSKLREKNISFPMLFGSRDLIQSLGITSFPSYLLITPDRKVEFILGNVYDVKNTIDQIFKK